MRHRRTACWALLAVLTTAASAEAQRATISPSSLSATEHENAEFTIDGSGARNAWIKYRVVDGTATEGTDFRGVSGDLCYEGPQTRLGSWCEGGAQATPGSVLVAHYTDYEEERDETYTVRAWVHRYETGRVDAEGAAIWSEPCASESCGAATATGRIVDVTDPEPPGSQGRVSFTSELATVDEGRSVSLSVTFTPTDGARHEAASVDWRTVDNEATSGNDYRNGSGTLRFSACSSSACGVQTRNITVSTIQDSVIEGGTHNGSRWEERFVVELSNPVNATMELRDLDWVLVSIIDDDDNKPPTVNPTASRTEIEAGESVRLSANARDSDGSIRAYRWSEAEDRGSFSETTAATVTWTAPHTEDDEEYTFTVVVHDNLGATTEGTVTVSAEGGNRPPQVAFDESGNFNPTSAIAGGEYLLSGAASDYDGEVVDLRWSGAGTFEGSATDLYVTWTAPWPEVTTVYTLTLTATDDDGATGSNSFDVEVSPEAATENRPPTVTASATPTRTTAGGEVQLEATATDPDRNSFTYKWSGPGRFSSLITRTPTWRAPSPQTETVYTLQVEVDDHDGGFATATVDVTVEAATAVDGTPEVSVSASKTDGIRGREEITLTATATDADGSISTYAWSGDGVFGNASAARTSWRAPTVERYDIGYTLTVRVTDDDSNTASASIFVSVTGNEPPTVTIEASPTEVYSEEVVDLTATASDADGSVAAYQWSSGDGEGTFLNATGATARWQAPVMEPGARTLRVTVTDDLGFTGTDTVTITVKGPKPLPEPEIDKLPVVTVEATEAEFEEGTTARVIVSLDKRAPSGASVRYRIGEASETEGCRDYEHRDSRLSLSGRTSAEVTFRVLADTCVNEANESVEVVFYDPVKVELGTDTAAVIIENIYSVAKFETTELTVREGASAQLRVVRDITKPGQRVAATVDVELEARGGATAGTDYEDGPKTARFSANQSTATVSFAIHSDDVYDEDGEGFKATLTNASGVRLEPASSSTPAIVEIEDTDGGDPVIEVRVETSGRVREGEAAVCRVTVNEIENRTLDRSLRIRVWTDGGTATAGTHYVSKTQWLSFGRGASQSREMRFETIARRENDTDVSVNCNVGTDTTVTTDYDYSGTYDLEVARGASGVVIVNRQNLNTTADRGPVWGFEETVKERASTVTVEMNLDRELPTGSDGSTEPLVVRWTTSSMSVVWNAGATATAGSDYTARNGTYTFRPGGPTSFRFSIPIRCDNDVEDDEVPEFFFVNATGERQDGTSLQGESTVRVLIASEFGACGSTPRILSIADATTSEGRDMEFTLTTTKTYGESLLVDYRTVDGSARAGGDYTQTSGTLKFNPNASSATIVVPTLMDGVRDEDETFRVRISNARLELSGTRKEIADDEAVGTILDGLGIEAKFTGVPARHDEAPFRFELWASTELTNTAAEIQNALTAGDAAEFGVEKRTARRWTITVTPLIAGHISVSLDSTLLRGPGNRRVLPVETVTIFGKPTVSIADATAPEWSRRDGESQPSRGAMRFTAKLDYPPDGTVSAAYATADGTAQAGRDYEATSGRVTFAPGETEATILVQLFTATVAEEDETFTVTLSDPRGRLAISSTMGVATGTITDDTVNVEIVQPTDARTDDSNFEFAVIFRPAFRADTQTVQRVEVDLARGLVVTNGRVRRATASCPCPADRRVQVSIAPEGHLDVTVTLPEHTQIADRYTTYAQAVIPGVVTLEVADAEVEESDASNARNMRFVVSRNQHHGEEVSVDYATEDGTATAGSDYQAISGTLHFTSEEQLSLDVLVPIIADDVNEGDETFKLKLSNARGATITDAEGIGTIKNDGPMPMGLISRFGRATASHIAEQVERRMGGRPRGSTFEIRHRNWMDGRGYADEIPAGGTGGAGRARTGMERFAGGAPQGSYIGRAEFDDDPLDGATLAMNGQALGGNVSVWSETSRSSFTGREGPIALRGDVRTRTVGADYSKGRVTTGVALGRSTGTGTYNGRSSGEVTSTLTGLYPWIGYRASERVTVWTVAGRGAGGLLLTTPAGVQEAPVSMTMTAAGTRAKLTRGTGLDLAVKTDALWVGTAITESTGPNGNLGAASANVTRVRTGVEGSRAYTVKERLQVQPILEIGVRRDGGDAENGAGIDFGGGLVVAYPRTGLGVDLRWRTMIVHQAEQFSERGVSVTFTYNPTSTPHGLRARVTPAWGANASGSADTLWRGESMGRFGYTEDGGRLDGEIGYGLPLGHLKGTPRLGFSSASHGRVYRIGYGLTAAESDDLAFELAFEVQRGRSTRLPGANHGASARTSLSW